MYVSANSDGTAVTYCYNASTEPGITHANVSSTYDIYLMGTDGKEKQLTTNADACVPVFSPDGKTIAYESYQAGTYYPHIFTMNVDGSNQKALYPDTILAYTEYQFFPQFSPDGKSLVFCIEVIGVNDVARTHQPNTVHESHWQPGRNFNANNALHKVAHPQDVVPYQSGWYTMGLTAATPNFVYMPYGVWGPAVFSSDGTKLLFTDIDPDLDELNIFSVGLDGSGLAELTSSSDEADFSPVAYKGIILFNRYNSVTSSVDIYAMDENGVNQIPIHSTPDVWEGLIDAYWEY
jgi:Tol biopolymer transport system component